MWSSLVRRGIRTIEKLSYTDPEVSLCWEDLRIRSACNTLLLLTESE